MSLATIEMIKVNFGCGDNPLDGWQNHDIAAYGKPGIIETDLSQKLPYGSNSVAFIQCEHFLEHLTAPQCLEFLKECYRILEIGGILRVSVPAIERIAKLDPSYEIYLREELRRPVHTRGESIHIALSHWGHMTAWTAELLKLVLQSCDFKNVIERQYGQSDKLELQAVDLHATGHYLNKLIPGITEILKEESAIFEAQK